MTSEVSFDADNPTGMINIITSSQAFRKVETTSRLQEGERITVEPNPGVMKRLETGWLANDGEREVVSKMRQRLIESLSGTESKSASSREGNNRWECGIDTVESSESRWSNALQADWEMRTVECRR